MNNLALAFILVVSTASFARPFQCDGTYDAGVFKFSVTGVGEVAEGSQLSLKLQDYDFDLSLVKDDKGTWLHATTTDPDGNESLAIYSNDTNMVRIHVKKAGIKHHFDCLAK